LEDLGVDGRIIIKWIFKELDGGMNWIALAQDRDRCECGSEPFGSIKCEKFLDWMSSW
jgi:hypothetical protein